MTSFTTHLVLTVENDSHILFKMDKTKKVDTKKPHVFIFFKYELGSEVKQNTLQIYVDFVFKT